MSRTIPRPSLLVLADHVSDGGRAFWICSLAVAVAEGSIGWWLRRLPIEDRMEAGRLALWLCLLLGLLGLRVAFSWGRDHAQETAALRAGDRFVRGIWSSSLGVDAAPWFTREGRETVESGTRAALVLAASATALLVLLPLMIWLSPLLSCALLVLAPLLGMAGRRRWKAARDWAGREQTLLSRHALDETWSWRSAAEARASGGGSLLSRLRRGASIALVRERIAGTSATTRGQASTEAAAHAAGWLLATLALLAWTRGLLPAPDLLAFLAAALLAYRPIREAGRALPSWHRHRTLLERVVVASDPAADVPVGDRLEVRDLRVVSPEGAVLVDGPTFALAPGEAYLVSGANGSGKTSLIAGLLGWRQATGVLVRPVRIRALAQEPVLPPFPPRRWSGVDDPTTLALLPALFPHGLPCAWNQPLLEGGSRLSRGERARLALLCLTAQPADLWLFDEPFSALPMGERTSILSALRGIQGSTTLLFTDPLSIDPADAPVVWEPEPGRPGPRILRL